jgi:hypothetical protein
MKFQSLSLIVVMTVASPCLADAPVTFERIVQTGDLIPGSAVTFTSLSRASVSQGNFAWRGAGNGVAGIYAIIDGQPRVVAQSGMPIPGSGGVWTLSSFTNQLGKIDGTDVVFRAGNGIYASFASEPLIRIADTTMVDPGTGNPFAPFQQPYISNGVITFSSGTLFSSATVSEFSLGNVSNVWNSSTQLPPPMVGNFSGTGNGVSSESTIAVQAFDSGLQQGILTNRGGSLSIIASAYANMPGQSFPFTQFLDPTVAGDSISFIAWGPAGSGPGRTDSYKALFEDVNGTLTTVVDTNTLSPATGTRFIDIARAPAVYGDSLLFGAGVHGATVDSLYIRLNNQLHRVIDTTQTLDGKTVVGLNINSHAMQSETSGVGQFTLAER